MLVGNEFAGFKFSLIKALNIKKKNLGYETGYSFLFHSFTGTILKAEILTSMNTTEALEIGIYTFP